LRPGRIRRTRRRLVWVPGVYLALSEKSRSCVMTKHGAACAARVHLAFQCSAHTPHATLFNE
jgi:hypothetical protein